jgi:type I restriction enzyme M protein
LSETKTTSKDLNDKILKAARIFRKKLNASENYKIVLPTLFIKRLNDTFDENCKKFEAQGKKPDDPVRHRAAGAFYVPKMARWKNLVDASKNVGSALISACQAIEESDKSLEGTMTYTEFNNKKKYPDDSLRELILEFDNIELGNDSLENPDILGDAFEYLLETFADETKKKGGQFYTPREVVQLLVRLMDPQPNHSVCDPMCGSGGFLIHSRRYVHSNLKKGENIRGMKLHGQDSNPDTVSMGKMNMILHEIPNARIEDGDVLEKPKLVDGSQLIKYDRVLANFPFSEDWKPSGKDKDAFGRFKYGIPPGDKKADFAFIQHMFSTLNENGRAAIISGQGTLFRGSKEEEIRKKMILGDAENNLQGDIIEGIIALPQALFYGTGIPGCVYILNKNKPKERKNKIIFIYAARKGHFANLPARNKLRIQDIEELESAFKNYKDEYGFCYIADLEELEENEYNLNVPRYVDTSIPEIPVDIPKTIREINELKTELIHAKEKVYDDLHELKLGNLD